MPLEVQCHAVVIRNDSLERVLEGGAASFADIAPNGMSYSDDMLSQASFMASVDAEEFIRLLELRGLSRENSPPDFVVVRAPTKEVAPECDWLLMFEFEGRLAVTMRGNESTTLIAPQHAGSELQHYTAEEIQRDFEFVERKNNVDTYRNKKTGELVYSARQTESPDEVFKKAFEQVWKHHREPGFPPADGQALEELQVAIETLQSLVARYPELSRPRLALGMAWYATGNLTNARRQLEKAAELEPEMTTIYKELGSVCLAMRDHESAVTFAEKAVAVEPDNPDLVGNLATCQLLAGATDNAEQTIQYALKLKPDDRINFNIQNLIRLVKSGQRPSPNSLEELMGAPSTMSQEPHNEISPSPRSQEQPQSWLTRTWKRLVRRGST